jgi:hypothetical protein
MEYERYLFRLRQENMAMRQVGIDQINQIISYENMIEDITHSRAFRLGRQIRRLIPLGSRREKWILKIFSTLGKFFHKSG